VGCLEITYGRIYLDLEKWPEEVVSKIKNKISERAHSLKWKYNFMVLAIAVPVVLYLLK